jgi:putative transposase
VIVLYNEKAGELGVTMETVEVMPNHVHLFVSTSPVPALYFLSGQMKGYTARNLRAAFPSLVSPLPSLWTCGDYIESVGHICKDAIEKTIEEQRGQ